MNIYIAGIELKNSQQLDQWKTKLNRIEGIIRNISTDADRYFNEPPLILVVIREYGLSAHALPRDEKNQCLQRIQTIVSRYSNMIFIPGSISSFKQLTDKESIKNKLASIEDNYKNSRLLPLFPEYKDLTLKISNADAIPKLEILKNSAYLFFSNQKFSHLKSFPFNEKTRLNRYKTRFDNKNLAQDATALQDDKNIDCIYDVGLHQPIKQLVYQNAPISIGLQVCAEHSTNKISSSQKLKTEQPNIQVIISDSMNYKPSHTYSEIVVQLDSDTKKTMRVVYNPFYEKTRVIDMAQLVAFNYSMAKSKRQPARVEIEVLSELNGKKRLDSASNAPASVLGKRTYNEANLGGDGTKEDVEQKINDMSNFLDGILYDEYPNNDSFLNNCNP